MIIHIPIFNSTIKMYVGNRKKIENKYDLDCTKNYEAFVFRVNESKKYDYIVWFSKGLKSDVLVHESNHLCNMILKDIGHIQDLDNDEVQSYLLQFIYKEIKNKYKK